MDLQIFADVLEREIRRQSELVTAIERQTIRKNNDVYMEALVLHGENSMIAPTIYLQPFYELYREGTPVSELGRMAAGSLKKAFSLSMDGIGSFFDYSSVKDTIYCRLVSRSRNSAGIRDLCHEEWLDLAVTYYHGMCLDSEEKAQVQIRKGFLEKWQIDEEQLREDAWRNTMRDYPPVLEPLDQVLSELHASLPAPDWQPPLYLLSNRQRTLGAVCIAFPGQADRIAEELDSDYYVIPSSIHECLILRADEQHSPEELNEMVAEVNRTQVSPQEILADHVYCYSMDRREIIKA